MVRHVRQWFLKQGAAPEALAHLRAAADMPPEYLELLASSNGGEGNLDLPPYGFVLFSAEEASEKNLSANSSWPGFFVFGKGKGRALLAFDMRDCKPWPVVTIEPEAIDGEGSIVKIADDFSLFLTHIGVAPHGS